MLDPVVDFQRALLARHGLDPDRRTERGVSVVADPQRAGERTVSAYAVGDHVVVFSDEAVTDRVAAFEAPAPGVSLLDAFFSFGRAIGAEVLGSAVMKVHAGRSVDVDEAGDVAAIDRDRDVDVERLRELLDACSDDEIDEADIDIDKLDPIIRCAETQPGGALTAYSSAYSWDAMGGMWDIGVLTHPDHRGRGLGLRCVQRLVADLVADGQEPLYRHDHSNIASGRLSDRAGFVAATELAAIRVPT